MFGLDHDDEYNSYSRLQEAREDARDMSEAYAKLKKELTDTKAELTTLKDKTLVLNYFRATYGYIFWDQDDKVIKTIHENDAMFRGEYFESLFSYFGIEIVKHDKRPKFITLKELRYFGIEE